MSEMTVRKFENTLKHCYVTRCNCEKCPIHNNSDCFPFIVKTAYDIIISQEAKIENYQSSDVSPVRHGYWVKEKRDVLIHWHCSACKECYYLDMPNAEYCPHCGAKMDGKENE